MKKKFLTVLDVSVVNEIDKKVSRPCSRSDIINASLQYLLQTPYVFDSFVQSINDGYKDNAMRDIS